jgi:arylsulfatase A-like enzyme
MAGARSLILITIDCWRADHAGFMGYSRPTTPFLDSLAGESFVFENALAAGAPTYYSLPAILASRYPLAPGRDLLGLAPEETTLASVLQESGFATAAFCAANPYLSSRFGYDSGFDLFRDFLDSGTVEFAEEQGFQPPPTPISPLRSRANEILSRTCHAFAPLGAAYDELYFRYCQKLQGGKSESLDGLRRFPAADVIVDHAIAWLNGNAGEPFFLWLHLMDPHSPYFPKDEALNLMGDGAINADQAKYRNSYWNRGDLRAQRLRKKRDEVVALYDAGVRWADEQIRRLTEKLIDLNLWDQCALAVTADHGEEFLDHGGRFHPPLGLHEELIHVPLLLRVPEFVRGGRIGQPLGLIDLVPTLLDVLEMPSPADFRGRSRWSEVAESLVSERPVISECIRGCTNPFRRQNRVGPRILAVRKGNYKLVVDFTEGVEQLFDLNSDPYENDPLGLDTAKPIRRMLLECARKHVVESHKSRDFDRRMGSQLRELRLEWAQSVSSAPN